VKRNPWVAGLLSLVVPGLGQIYAGKGYRGAAIIFAAVVIANLNVIVLPLIAVANPVIPPQDASAAWRYWIPRVVHDVASLWSAAFWVWAVVDAVVTARIRRTA
jgi:TM2 domain-containing membrane protein YozV